MNSLIDLIFGRRWGYLTIPEQNDAEFLFLIFSLFSFSHNSLWVNTGMTWNGWIHYIVWVNYRMAARANLANYLNDRQRLRVMNIYRIQSCGLKLVLACIHVCV